MTVLRWQLTVTMGVIAAISWAGPVQAQESMAHQHMGHVADQWRDTPGQKGFLPTAEDEAAVAARHADLAVSNTSNLASIQLHVSHVFNVIDPSVVAQGPGDGYGLLKSSQGIVTHIDLAANSADASANVKAHAVHVAASAGDVVTWCREILDLAQQVDAATSAEAAAEAAEEIQTLAHAIVDGQDANGDGTVSWSEGEGGLAQAAQHMALMERGEGM
jgi:hypothetical protein